VETVATTYTHPKSLSDREHPVCTRIQNEPPIYEKMSLGLIFSWSLLTLSYGKLGATLAAAGLEDVAARLCTRAHEKTMRSCALLLTWLIGSLRHKNLRYGATIR
jgi:hypothetical protein